MNRSDLTVRVAAACLCVMFTAGFCFAQVDNADKVLASAPSKLLGVVHIDVASTDGEVGRVVQRIVAALEFEGKEELAAHLDKMYPKISSIDVYLMKFGRAPMAAIAVHGEVTAEEIAKGVSLAMGREFNVKSMGNGVSIMSPLLVVNASENDQMKGDALWITMMGVPLQQMVGKASQQEKAPFKTLISRIDTKTQFWGAMIGLNWLKAEIPSELSFSMPLSSTGPIHIELLLADEAMARLLARNFSPREKDPIYRAIFRNIVTCKRSGRRVVLRFDTSMVKLTNLAYAGFLGVMEKTRQENVISVLRGIGTAVAMHRVAKEASPRSFKELIANGTISANMLIHPNRKGDKDKAVTDGVQDYVLIALPEDAPKHLVLVYEKPELAIGDVVCVTLNDGSVFKLSREDFARGLAATKKWLKQNDVQK